MRHAMARSYADRFLTGTRLQLPLFGTAAIVWHMSDPNSAGAASLVHEDHGSIGILTTVPGTDPIRIHMYGDHGYGHWNSLLSFDVSADILARLSAAIVDVRKGHLKSALVELVDVEGAPGSIIIRGCQGSGLIGNPDRKMTLEVLSKGQQVTFAAVDDHVLGKFLNQASEVLELPYYSIQGAPVE